MIGTVLTLEQSRVQIIAWATLTYIQTCNMIAWPLPVETCSVDSVSDYSQLTFVFSGLITCCISPLLDLCFRIVQKRMFYSSDSAPVTDLVTLSLCSHVFLNDSICTWSLPRVFFYLLPRYCLTTDAEFFQLRLTAAWRCSHLLQNWGQCSQKVYFVGECSKAQQHHLVSVCHSLVSNRCLPGRRNSLLRTAQPSSAGACWRGNKCQLWQEETLQRDKWRSEKQKTEMSW